MSGNLPGNHTEPAASGQRMPHSDRRALQSYTNYYESSYWNFRDIIHFHFAAGVVLFPRVEPRDSDGNAVI